MANSNSPRNWQSAIVLLTGTVVAVVVIGCLYWAQTIFIPVALAIYLTFLLAPLATYLQRRGLGRVPSVMAVMLLAVLLLGGLLWLVTRQVSALAAELPHYNENIQAKVRLVTDRLDEWHETLSRLFSAGEGASGTDRVVVKPDAPPWLSSLPAMLAPLAQGLGGGGLALVLTAFMLLKREDLRNRLLRLAGEGRVTVATRDLDETAQRLGRFLRMQVLINAIAGVSIGLGLMALWVKYSLLWGFLVFALRYIPYVGVWIAALPPVLLSLALFPGWLEPVLVVGLLFVVEMICGNVLEPWLFGRSMGVSEVSLLVSAAFWAFLWGPIGMVLSSPLTVCLVVLAKYYPPLGFLGVLLGDEPVLDPEVRFYQRLLAHDQDEAAEVVQARLNETPAEQIFDEVLIPALVSAHRDRSAGDLPPEDEAYILEATREIGEDLAEQIERPGAPPGPHTHVLACPASDAEDEVALHLLAATLDPAVWEVEVLAAHTLGSELVSKTRDGRPDLICIAALPPGNLAHTRYLCKRLRARFPDVTILVGRWGQEAGADVAQRLSDAGADHVGTTLDETRKQLQVQRPLVDARKTSITKPA